MTQEIVKILETINLGQTFIILVAFWFFYNRLDKKIEKLEAKLTDQINKLSEKINKLDERVSQLETRVAVIESRLSDISTNVTHLMWQNQIPHHHKDLEEK